MAEILVVDDHAEIRRLFTRVLEREGYAVRTAVNGDKALEAIYVRKPDLVLLDIDMPRRNGYSTCEEIRKFDRLLPVIFITAYGTQTNELRARGMGADDFFQKDADESLILSSVRRALERAAAISNCLSQPRKVMIGKVEIDFDMLTAKGDGIDERLTKTEADFLWLLNSARGRYFSYDEIFEVLRGRGYVGDDGLLYVYISRLNKKLSSAGVDLRNERGVGYALMA